MAALAAHARHCADAGGAPLTRFSEADLREYRRRNPHLFKGEQAPAPVIKPGAGLPRSASNGYANEAQFQVDAVVRLKELGWDVQESFKGSAKGGSVWMGKGWPDLQIYRQDGQRRMWFAELKQPGNKPSPAQLECHARLRAAGFCVVVAWTLEEVLAAEKEERP